MKWLHTPAARSVDRGEPALRRTGLGRLLYSPRMNLGDIVINPGLVRVAQDAAIGAIVGSQTVGIPTPAA